MGSDGAGGWKRFPEPLFYAAVVSGAAEFEFKGCRFPLITARPSSLNAVPLPPLQFQAPAAPVAQGPPSLR